MSTGLGALGITRTSRTGRRSKVRSSTQPQGHQNASVPSDVAARWTSEQPYKYVNPSTSKSAWERCDEILEEHDEAFCKELIEEISFLMVVAGLFLAVVTAFTIESYKSLQEDKQDTMSDLLIQVVRLLNDTSTQGQGQLPKRFTPDYHKVVVNQLWFMSMVLSLVAVLIGTFCLQWIFALRRATFSTRNSTSSVPIDVLGMRHLRVKGFVGWGVHHAPDVLLLIVQLSIALFTSGLIYFLWNINHIAAIPALVVAGVTCILLCLINSVPFFQPLVGVLFPKLLTVQCPYKSPTSWLLRSVWNLGVWRLLPLKKRWAGREDIAGRFSAWLSCHSIPFTDYLWKDHDKSYALLQESSGVRSRLRSFGLGLRSAFDILVLEPDAVDLIYHSVQYLLPDLPKAEHLTLAFRKLLCPFEERILDGERWPFINPEFPDDPAYQFPHFSRLVDDFSIAFILQNLVTKRIKLGRILLKHRVELYIRIQNSRLFLQNDEPGRHLEFGSSLTCPLIDLSDVGRLDLQLKYQFLRYVMHYFDQEYTMNANDLLVAAKIVKTQPRDVYDRSYSVGDGTEGKRGGEGGYNHLRGTRVTGVQTDGGLLMPINQNQWAPESDTREVTATKKGAKPELELPATCAHGVHKLGFGDLDRHGENGEGQDAGSSFSGPEHTDPPAKVDDEILDSSRGGSSRERAGDPEFSSLELAFGSLCLEVKEALLELPASVFVDHKVYAQLQALLGNVVDQPPQTENTRVETSPA